MIEPTRTLESTREAPGNLTVVSEPPGLEVFLDGSCIGKTPVWSKQVPPGVHKLRVMHSETEIYVEQGKTLKISLFKGKFINISEQEKGVKSQVEPQEENAEESHETKEPSETRPEKDLTLWERYINKSSPHF